MERKAPQCRVIPARETRKGRNTLRRLDEMRFLLLIEGSLKCLPLSAVLLIHVNKNCMQHWISYSINQWSVTVLAAKRLTRTASVGCINRSWFLLETKSFYVSKLSGIALYKNMRSVQILTTYFNFFNWNYLCMRGFQSPVQLCCGVCAL